MNELQSLAYSLFAQSQLMIETLDKLKGTKLSSKKERNLMKRVQELNMHRVNKIHEDMDEDQQRSINDMIRATNTTIKAIKHKGVELYIGLMEAVEKGEVKFEEDKQTS